MRNSKQSINYIIAHFLPQKISNKAFKTPTTNVPTEISLNTQHIHLTHTICQRNGWQCCDAAIRAISQQEAHGLLI